MNKKDINKVLNRLNKIRCLVDEITEILQADYSGK